MTWLMQFVGPVNFTTGESKHPFAANFPSSDKFVPVKPEVPPKSSEQMKCLLRFKRDLIKIEYRHSFERAAVGGDDADLFLLVNCTKIDSIRVAKG